MPWIGGPPRNWEITALSAFDQPSLPSHPWLWNIPIRTMYKSTRPWKVLKIAGLGEKGSLVCQPGSIVLRQKCSLIKDVTSDDIQDFAMNAMFTCVCVLSTAFRVSCKTTRSAFPLRSSIVPFACS